MTWAGTCGNGRAIGIGRIIMRNLRRPAASRATRKARTRRSTRRSRRRKSACIAAGRSSAPISTARATWWERAAKAKAAREPIISVFAPYARRSHARYQQRRSENTPLVGRRTWGRGGKSVMPDREWCSLRRGNARRARHRLICSATPRGTRRTPPSGPDRVLVHQTRLCRGVRRRSHLIRINTGSKRRA